MMSRACIKTVLPTKKCGLALVVEAAGSAEEQEGQPFVGTAGKALRKLCMQTGIDFRHGLVTNVFHERPEKNEIARIFVRPSVLRLKNPEITSLGNRPRGYLIGDRADEIQRLINQEVAFRINISDGRHCDLASGRRSRGGE